MKNGTKTGMINNSFKIVSLCFSHVPIVPCISFSLDPMSFRAQEVAKRTPPHVRNPVSQLICCGVSMHTCIKCFNMFQLPRDSSQAAKCPFMAGLVHEPPRSNIDSHSQSQSVSLNTGGNLA